MRRTRKQIQDDIDAHLAECRPCRRWFRDDDDQHAPCPVMAALHDEYDRR